MADPLSIIAGVTGIIGFAVKITQIAVQFGVDWKDAPKSVRMFVIELQGLQTVLDRTVGYIRSNSDLVEAFQNEPPAVLMQLRPTDMARGDLADIVAVCSAELKDLLAKLENRAKGSRVGWERLKAPFLAKSTRDSVDRLRRYCQDLNDAVSIDIAEKTYHETRDLRREQQEWYEAEGDRKILNWLSSLSFSNKQRDTLSTHHPGTGQWLLELAEFERWRDADDTKCSLLWCPGIPGAGKTVMTSIIADHLKTMYTDKRVAIAFVYCDYKESRSQTASTLLSSLVRQLVEKYGAIPNEVRVAYDSHGSGSLSTDQCAELLLSVASYFQRTLLLVDALDECSDESSEGRSEQQLLLKALLEFRQGCNTQRHFRVLITSRENRRIEGQLGEYSCIPIRATDQDIESYIRSRITDKTGFAFAREVERIEDLGQKIVSKLVGNAQDMFLLPRLHLDYLEHQTNVRSMRRALENLPTKLDQVYDSAMQRIEGQDEEYRSLAMRVLLWLMHVSRPLQLEELQHALSTEVGDRDLDEEGLISGDLLVSVCAGLVGLDEESGTIRLVHFSVQEYLEKNEDKFPDAELEITRACLSYLLYDAFAAGPCNSPKNWYKRLLKYPFLVYAAQNWGIHAQKGAEWEAKELIIELLEDESKLSNAIEARDLSPHTWRGWSENLVRDDTGLHVAAAFGLGKIAGLLLGRRADVGARDGMGWTPLHYAACEGDDAMVRLLVEGGADVDATTDGGETALMWAAWHSKESTVKTLLDAGASVEVVDRHGTALHRAAFRGHASILRLLLEKATDVTVRTEEGLTALHRAVEGDKATVLPLLIESSPDGYIDQVDLSGFTALTLAIRRRSLEKIQCLINEGADVNVATNSGKTTLDIALELASSPIIEVLVGRNALPRLAWGLSSPPVQQWVEHSWYPNLIKILAATQVDHSIAHSPVATKSREDLIVVDRNSKDEAYLAIVIPSTHPAPISRIVFRTESHDQGMLRNSVGDLFYEPEHYVGMYLTGTSWFEARISRAGRSGHQPALLIQENVYASETYRVHTNIWDHGHPRFQDWLDRLQPGDVLQVYAMTGGGQLENHVKKVEVNIYSKGEDISPTKIAEAGAQDGEIAD